MSKYFYKYGFFISSFILLILCALIIKEFQIDEPDSLKINFSTRCKLNNDLNFLTEINASNVKKTFPYEKFILSANWWCNDVINSTLVYLDSINSLEPGKNEDILISCLTDSALFKEWTVGSLDSLNFLLSMADKYLVYAEITPSRRSFYKAIANAWVGYVTNKLASLVNQKKASKYTFKVQYIRARCMQFEFSPDFGNTAIEKVVINFTEQNWHYLFIQRYWYATSVLFKILTIVPLICVSFLFSYGLICIYQKHRNRK